jgi:hypothetical protein
MLVRMQARVMRRLILSNDFEFWQNCTNYCTVMKAVVAELKEFDSNQPCMGNIYIIMRALHHHVVALHNAPLNMLGHLVDPLKVVFKKREALIYSDLHYVGALFNPHLIYNMELHNEKHTMVGLIKVSQKLYNTDEEFQAVKVEFNLHFHTISPYCGDHVWRPMGVKEVAHVLWFTSGSVGKLLPCIAWRIFAQVVSSSSCEQNWSSYSIVHSKAQNKLHSSRVEDLVYVLTNSRVFNQK